MGIFGVRIHHRPDLSEKMIENNPNLRLVELSTILHYKLSPSKHIILAAVIGIVELNSIALMIELVPNADALMTICI